jgi:hypothetical protein
MIGDIFASRTFSPTEFVKLLSIVDDKILIPVRNSSIGILEHRKSFFHSYTFKKIGDLVAADDLWHPCGRIAEKSGF